MTLTTTTALSPLTLPSGWPTLRALPADTAQRIFRGCLTALSRPGTIARLPPGCVAAPVPAVLAPLLTLTDLMVPLCALDADTPEARQAVELVAGVTGAKVTEPSGARFALAFGESAHLAELPVGSHWSPEFGALLCQRVIDLRSPTEGSQDEGDGAPAVRLRLTGPGVNGSSDLTVTGLTPRFVELRAGLTGDFPAGIDILLVTDDGDVAGLPRTTRIEVR